MTPVDDTLDVDASAAAATPDDSDPLAALLQEFCDTVGLYAPPILRLKSVQVKGLEVKFWKVEADKEAFYFAYQFGAVSAGRTLKVFRLMLEANVLVYAKDRAVMGMDPDTGGVVLLVRGLYGPQTTGRWLADTLAHFAEHAIYWKKNILDAMDEMFNGISSGTYRWLRA